MSRLLQERHRRLREAEVFLEDVPRQGSFRIALVWPNLYFVGMSNLGFQAVYRLLNRHGRRRLRAGVPAGRRGQGRARAHREPAHELRDGDAAAGLRRRRLLDLLRERLPARAAGAAARRDPAPRQRARPARPARRAGRGRDVPEPGAARRVRGSDRRRRGRADGAANDGGAARRKRSAGGPRVAPAEGRLLRPEPLRGALQRRRHRRRLRRSRASWCASAAGRAPWASRSR